MRYFLALLSVFLALPAWAQDQVNTVTPFNASVGVTSAQVVAVATQPARKLLYLVNPSDTDVWCEFGAAAVVSTSSVFLKNGGGGMLFDVRVPQQAVNCITTVAGKTIVGGEGR